MKMRLITALFLTLTCLAFGQEYQVTRLGGHINTELDEISPILSTDGKTLIFTRIGSPDFNTTLIENNIDLSQSLPQVKYETYLRGIYSSISGNIVANHVESYYNQDIFIARTNSKRFDQLDHPPYPLNGALPNSLCSSTPDPNKFVVANCFHEDGGMDSGFSVITKQDDGLFSFPSAIVINDFYTYSEEVGFSMSPDGHTIIMSLERDDSFGDLDLYASFRISDQLFSAPINLGPSINTAKRELAPYISRDNNHLFFSSNRGESQDFNIYTAQRIAYSWREWDEIEKLPEPINSSFDDSHPYFVAQTDELFFISTRDGNSDIYRVNFTPITKEEKKVSIKGKIVEASTQKAIRASLDYGPSDDKGPDEFFNSHTGHFNINLSFDENYRFVANKTGYMSSEIELDPDHFDYLDSNYEMILELTPIKKMKFIKIGNLQFKQSEATLLPTANKELNRLYRILNADPSIHIRIEGHTDSKGDGKANSVLSKERARAIKKYLVSQGISTSRISTRGYGDSRPLNKNSTEKDRQLNRRVEIRIIRTKK